MTQIERIIQMEHILQEAADTLGRLDALLERYAALQPQIADLGAYYGSQAWRDDFASDAAGLLPADLRRGVLSEDEVFDLLLLNRVLLSRMQALAQEYNAEPAD